MKNLAHNVTTRMHMLFERCNQTGLCTNNDWWLYQDLSNVVYSHAI
jgi:hypothetical protein